MKNLVKKYLLSKILKYIKKLQPLKTANINKMKSINSKTKNKYLLNSELNWKNNPNNEQDYWKENEKYL